MDVHIFGNKIGSALDDIDSIGILRIDNWELVHLKRFAPYYSWTKALDVKMPQNVTKNIDTIILQSKLPRRMKQLQKQFPNTVILYDFVLRFGEPRMEIGPQSTYGMSLNRSGRHQQKPKDNSVDAEKLMENLPPRQPMPQLLEEKRK